MASNPSDYVHQGMGEHFYTPIVNPTLLRQNYREDSGSVWKRKNHCLLNETKHIPRMFFVSHTVHYLHELNCRTTRLILLGYLR
jgi:hypothetical protein